MNRRLFIKTFLASLFANISAFSKEKKENIIFKKKIPSSGEYISTIGMGTWLTFDIGFNSKKLKQRSEILNLFFKYGGQMIDSSPMYGTSEKVIGKALSLSSNSKNLFSATKIWTPNKKHGMKQLVNSKKYWKINKFDLIQVHNLLNYESHLETLFKLKNDGLLKYVGVTTSHGSRHKKLKDIINKYEIDFIQLTYNIVDNEAEKYLLPLAKEKNIAVIANRPFQGGKLFDHVKNKKLNKIAINLGIKSWAEYFLKFITSHPNITCAIPATSRVDHMKENMTALYGIIPSLKERKKLMLEIINT